LGEFWDCDAGSDSVEAEACAAIN